MSEYTMDNQDVQQYYRARGFGGRVGFGESCALLVIDLAPAWTSPESPMGADLSSVLESTRVLLEEARFRGLPAFFTTTAFDPDLVERGQVINRKRTGREILARGGSWVQICREVEPRRGEVVIEKQRASAFVGTTLVSQLIARRVDTVIITGCATSGCIRATAADAHDYNYHVIVPRDAVGDRNPLAQEANLLDIDRSLGDVMPVSEVLAHLATLPAAESRTS